MSRCLLFFEKITLLWTSLQTIVSPIHKNSGGSNLWILSLILFIKIWALFHTTFQVVAVISFQDPGALFFPLMVFLLGFHERILLRPDCMTYVHSRCEFRLNSIGYVLEFYYFLFLCLFGLFFLFSSQLYYYFLFNDIWSLGLGNSLVEDQCCWKIINE